MSKNRWIGLGMLTAGLLLLCIGIPAPGFIGTVISIFGGLVGGYGARKLHSDT